MTYKQLKTFVKQRLFPEFQSGYYKTLIKDPKATTQEMMKIRDSSLVFRSSSQGSAMEGLQVDFLSLDEYDRLNPMAEQSGIESQKSSKFKMLRRWSTPTVANYGINRLYNQSDQRRWFYKCEHCGHEQTMDYEKNIEQVNKDGIDLDGLVVKPGTFQFVCQKCHRPLDRWYSGHWVVTNPGSGRIHGYNISQMDAVWVTADALKQSEMRAESKQFFYNYTLGFPYEDKGTKFNDEDVTMHIDSNYEKPDSREGYKFVVSGIDWGQHDHHIVTLGTRADGQIDLMDLTRVPRSTGVEHIEEDLNLVVRTLNKYQPDLILADQGFSGNYVDLLAKYFGMDRVYGVIVRSALSNGDPMAHFSNGDGKVTLDKLTQNIIAMSNIKRGDIHFWNGFLRNENGQRFITHFKNVVIRTDEKENKQTHLIEHDRVILRKGPDHFAQSFAYAMAGLNKLMKEEAQKRRIKTQIDYVDSTVFTPEQTDIQKEYDIDSHSVEL